MICAIILLYCLINAEDKVERHISAIGIWTVFCFGITEILSMFSAISTISIWTCWLSFDVVLVVLNLLKHKNNVREGINRLKKIEISSKLILVGVWGVIMLTIALMTEPYNYDSMTYHLPRIFHWLEHGTVGHYATHIDRQVANPVLGEFINLQVYSMSGGNDRFVNLLQYCSYLTNGILVYYIAKKLRCFPQYCTMAAVLFYSSPIAFAEAFSTQVDNYSALWLLCLVYVILEFLNPMEKISLNKTTSLRIMTLSLCVAFSYLSKPSIGIGMAFFAIWLLIVVIKRRDNILILGGYLLLAGSIITTLLVPEFLRNITTFDALLAPVTSENRLIGTCEPAYVLVNFVKNFTFNMPIAWIANSAQIILKGVTLFARILSVDIDNPSISGEGRQFFVHGAQSYGHDTAVNPIIMYLLIGCILIFIVNNRKKYLQGIRNQYFVVTCISFLTLCVVARWEPYNSRYMIAFFAILSPAIISQIETFFYNKKKNDTEMKFSAIFYFLCVCELLGLLYYHGNIAKSYSGYEGYFCGRETTFGKYKEIVNIINDRGYENIGVILGSNTCEYPFLVMLNNNVHINHVNVANPTKEYENMDFIPDVIINMDSEMTSDTLFCHGNEYEIIAESGENSIIYLLEKKENRP